MPSNDMSRMSIGAFLSQAKNSLSKSIQSNGKHPASFVIGNQSADLDSITCALVYAYIRSSAPEARKAEKYVIPVTNIPSKDLRLRPELTALLKHTDVQPSELVTLDDLGELHKSLPPEKTDWTLVDHNVLLDYLGEHYSKRVTGVVDHHVDEEKVPKDAEPRIIEKAGSCASHVTNYLSDAWNSIPSSSSTKVEGHGDAQTIDAQVAQLSLSAILIDTVNFKAEDKVTDHDRKAVKYLESKIKASPELGPRWDRDAFFEEINDAKSDLDDLSLKDILKKDYKGWEEGGLKLGISSAVRSIEYLMKKENKFVETLHEYAKNVEVDIFAVMCSHNDNNKFERQLLLLTVEGANAAVDAAERFVETNAEELQLEDSKTKLDDSVVPWLRFWEEKNLAASRKMVAPMLREAMSQ